MEAALRDIAGRGCSVLVAGRQAQVKGRGTDTGGAFQTLADILPDVPASVAGMFEALPETEFRVDVSSTEVRKRQSQANH